MALPLCITVHTHTHTQSIKYLFSIGKCDVHRFSLPRGTGLIWLDNLNCFGSESRLESCSHNAIGTHDCSHREDVAISCFGTSPTPCELVCMHYCAGFSNNNGHAHGMCDCIATLLRLLHIVNHYWLIIGIACLYYKLNIFIPR